jgi:hypothetical protein
MDRIEPLKLAAKFNPPRLGIVYRLESKTFIHEFHLAPESLNESTEALIEAFYSNFPVYFRNINPYQMQRILDKMKSKQKPGLGRFSKDQMVNAKKNPNDLKKFNKFIDDADLYSQEDDPSEEINYNDVDRDMEDDSYSDDNF